MSRQPFGSLLNKKLSRSKREQKHFPSYLNLIRQCPCLICGQQAEAAHVRMSSSKYAKTNGRNDKWVVPLCPGHHRLYPNAQHNSGEQSWWDAMCIDPLEIALHLWTRRDVLEAMQALCRQ